MAVVARPFPLYFNNSQPDKCCDSFNFHLTFLYTCIILVVTISLNLYFVILRNLNALKRSKNLNKVHVVEIFK